MSRLICLTIRSADAPAFEVWLADGLYPGVRLASFSRLDEANRSCVVLAMHYRARALPLDEMMT
jgi:hypothetical protein